MKAARQMGNLSRRSRDIKTSISNALSSSPNRKDLQKIHSVLITFGLQNSPFFIGKLITKYSQFKDPDSALLVFHGNSHTKTVFLWNTIIRAMTHNACYGKALKFYVEMRNLGVKPDSYTFPSVINACGSLMDFKRGRVVHEHVVGLGFAFDMYISNALTFMYSRCNKLGHAQEVFDGMPQRDTVSWNSLISGYNSNGYFKEALEVYHQLRMAGLVPDSFSLSSILLSCGGLGEVVEGERVHCLVEKLGARSNVIVSNMLLLMYCKFDMLLNCWRVFHDMVCKNSDTWSIIIHAHFESGLYQESIRLFSEMVSHSKPDILTITYILRACTHVGNLNMGRYVHDYMVTNGYECDVVATNIIINMYAKCGEVLHARRVFEKAKNKDMVSWNSLLDGYVKNQSYLEAIELFRRMKTNFQPDYVTCIALLSICSELTDLNFTKELHCDSMKRGFYSTQIVGNTLVDVYAKCGKIEDSFKQFEQMKERNLASWATIISSCGIYGEGRKALEAFEQMKAAGILPDHTVFLALLNACSRSGLVEEGRACFEQMKREYNIVPRMEHYACVVDLLSRSGLLAEAEEFIASMPLKADASIWAVMLSACSGDTKIAEVLQSMFLD